MMDNTALENSIREESARAIAAIREKEALEIKKLDEAHIAEMESFRRQVDDETQARIRQELTKLENRAILERKKMRLRSIDRFIRGTVDEVVKGMHDNPQYRKYLFDSISGIIERLPAGVEVRLRPDDVSAGKDVVAKIAAAGENRDIAVVGDPGIKWGGSIVVDKKGGRIFNNTMERIYFRKSLLIRQKVMDVLTRNAPQET
jgi:vacuolar-type H+-ATPase subunit E/Vma4